MPTNEERMAELEAEIAALRAEQEKVQRRLYILSTPTDQLIEDALRGTPYERPARRASTPARRGWARTW